MSDDDFLYHFAVEYQHDEKTVARYKAMRPDLAEDIDGILAELALEPDPNPGPIDDPGCEKAWREFISTMPKRNVVYGEKDGQTTAFYEDAPDTIGTGTDKDSAFKDLNNKLVDTPPPPEPAAPTLKESGILTVKLPKPVPINDILCTHAAYREDKPEVQGYGANEMAAKSALLRTEGGGSIPPA